MHIGRFLWFASIRVRLAAIAVVAALLVACGGGGGGGGAGNPTPPPGSSPTPQLGSSPTPRPGSSPTPQPSAAPSVTPTQSGSNAKVILSENDTVAGLGVAGIENAALNDAGAVGVIITVSGATGSRAVLLGDTTGAKTALLTPSAAPAGDDLRTLAHIRLAETGAAIFQSGTGLNTDRLYFASDGVVTALAGAAPGVVAPTFRILGAVVLGGSDVVGFVGAGDDCTVTTVGTTTRTICTGHLFVGESGAVTEVQDPKISLKAISATQPQVSVTDTGVTFFSLPAAATSDAPVLVRYDKGALETVLAANAALPSVGRLLSPKIVAANADEKLFLTTTLASDPGPSRPTVLGILAGQTFTVLDREREPVGDQVVTSLRAVGLDETGKALYLVRIGQAGDTTAPLTLRLSDGSTAVDVAAERTTLPGTDKTLLSIASQRINRRGDVAFVATLGHIDGAITTVDEVRAVVRLADGTYLAPLSSANSGDIGTVSHIVIAGFDDNANLLLIATRPPNQSVLIYAPPVKP